MRSVNGHLVGFGAVFDSGENKLGYSEPDVDFHLNNTSQGFPWSVKDKSGYEKRKREYSKRSSNIVFDVEKMRDAFARHEVVKAVKNAKTKKEKMVILEEFHKAPESCRKRTALKLPCMERVRLVRQLVRQGYDLYQIDKILSKGRG